MYELKAYIVNNAQVLFNSEKYAREQMGNLPQADMHLALLFELKMSIKDF